MAPTTAAGLHCEARDEALEVGRHRRDVDELGEDQRPDQDQEQHGGRARALEQGVVERPPAQGAARQREAEGAHRSHARPFGGSEEAAIDPAHHEQEQRRHRPDFSKRGHTLGPRRALAGRPPGRMTPRRVHDGQAQKARSENAGQDPGHEELADVRLGEHAVDDHDGRGRDHDPERARARHGSRCELVRVTEPSHDGYATLAMVAAVAMDDPQIPPNPADAHTVAIASPPRKCPMKA
jgi:hypothetical protein